MRDDLSINAAEGMDAAAALAMGGVRAQKRKQASLKRKLHQGLSALPQATNEYMLGDETQIVTSLASFLFQTHITSLNLREK